LIYIGDFILVNKKINIKNCITNYKLIINLPITHLEINKIDNKNSNGLSTITLITTSIPNIIVLSMC